MNSSPPGVTQILKAIQSGDETATDQLFALVYQDLRRIARAKMAHEKPGQTLQPTALVHEAYLRLVGSENLAWNSRSHFFSAAAEAMRRILIERARRKARLKHGGGHQRITLDDVSGDEPDPEELLKIDEILKRLEARDSEMSQVVKLRYFAGLTVKETANALNISPRTVNRHWLAARIWMQREMNRSGNTIRKEPFANLQKRKG